MRKNYKKYIIQVSPNINNNLEITISRCDHMQNERGKE